jgi:prepilin-type N-terminal cleavage/methylation domain-containing protein
MRWVRESLRRRQDDDGFSLPEMLIAMTIFAAFLAVITATVSTMFQDIRHTTTVNYAAAQNARAFDTFDQEMRPASGVNIPGLGTNGQDFYIEFLTTDLKGQAICRQWRLVVSTDQLQQRSWSPLASPAVPSAWTLVANGIVNTTDPFSLGTSLATVLDYQQSVPVNMQLTNTQGVKPSATASSSTTVVAENTTGNTQSILDGNHNGSSDFPVCQIGVSRP